MRKINFIRLFVLLTILFFSNTLIAQEGTEKESNFDIGLDLQSRYIWRGINLGGTSPSMQPYMTYTVGKFEFGAWAAYSISGIQTGQEVDLYIGYTPVDAFTITVTDYFFPDGSFGAGSRNNYFDYNEATTGHVIEGMLSFNGTETIPVWLTFAMNIYGADKDANEDAAYSSYIELGYGKSFSDSELGIFIGAALSDKSGYYFNNSAGIINLGVSYGKEIVISDKFSLPVNGALIFNPEAENIFITFGVSF